MKGGMKKKQKKKKKKERIIKIELKKNRKNEK